jgi:hypothetical protein
LSDTTEKKPAPRRRRSRIFGLAIVVTIAVQTPLVAGLAHLGGHLLPVLALAAALTGGFMATVLGPRGIWGAPSRARLYLVLWPFFVWWTLGLLFAGLAPIALAVRALLSTMHTSPASALSTNAALATRSSPGSPARCSRSAIRRASAGTRSRSPVFRLRSTAFGWRRSPTCTAVHSPAGRASIAGSPR